VHQLTLNQDQSVQLSKIVRHRIPELSAKSTLAQQISKNVASLIQIQSNELAKEIGNV